MTNRDFFYWLQGHFELGAPNTYIDKRQADLILRHAAMVNNDPSERLSEVRAFARLLMREPVVGTAVAITDEMREVVSAEFLHVLDPQDGGPDVQAKLNAFHTANPHMDPNRPPDPSGYRPRC